jgi:SAM-dependent methyltransferase
LRDLEAGWVEEAARMFDRILNGPGDNVWHYYRILLKEHTSLQGHHMFNKMIASQFRKPSGILGHYTAFFMKKRNRDYYGKVIDLLGIQDNDSILEVGCGAGLAIQLIVSQNPECQIDGLDFSPLMVRKAERNNRHGIRQGRVKIISGDISDYSFKEGNYTKIFAINVIYFWPDLETILMRLNRLLATKGRLVLFMSSPERLRKLPLAHDDVFIKYTLDDVRNHLRRAGFSRFNHQVVSKSGLDTYYIRADK